MDLLEAFMAYLRNERHYAAATQAAYERDLRAFAAYMTAQYELAPLTNARDLQAIRPQMIRAWMAHQAIQSKTRQRKLSVLRTFFRYQRREGRVASNPVAKLQRPKEPERLPEVVPLQLLNEALSSWPETDSFEGWRDRAMLELLYGCGLRRQEVIQLTRQSVDLRSQVVQVVGKGNKIRRVPFGRQAREAVTRYLEHRQALGPAADNLLLTAKGRAIYPKLVHRTVEHFLQAAGTLGNTNPHVLRHSFATHLIENGADLNAVKELLGHASLAATEVYLHTSAAHLKKVYQQAHPKAER
jgi:integrase/recombinase XerC